MELRKQTDMSLKETTQLLKEIEQQQQSRKTAAEFFVTVLPNVGSGVASKETSLLGGGLSAVPEPMTAMTYMSKGSLV